jgi:hypothetical protein
METYEPVRYFALSYVWGNSILLGAHYFTENDGELKNNIPATIQDAIDITRRLGKRFLWVGSLCIDQKNPCEKAELISKMG